MKNLCLLAIVFVCVIRIARGDESWRAAWNAPAAVHRPLQIIHGHFPPHPIDEVMRHYRDVCGLGGVVMNVGGKNYLRDDGEWAKLVEAVRAARDAGLRVWIYDENGYPSLAAGGVVLDGHPELESQALVYDAKTNELAVRSAYEYTHACNKYDVARRYPNPLNRAATTRFLDVTHAEYRRRLGDELFKSVEAFFTDEPSLNAVNIGQIPEDVRKTIAIADPVDETVPLLPMVAWSDKFAESVNDDWQRSLFTGDTEIDRERRGKFWNVVAAHNANNFYAPIQNWCRANGTIASGHTLHEENVLAHVPLDGNKLTMLRLFEIPGLDMLNSDPRACQWGAWKAAAFPASAAYYNTMVATESASPSPLVRRRVMTEVSDFSQKMGADKKCATLAEMQATAAWQAAWGVTEFTLYYDPSDRDIKEYKAYCDFVWRLNAMLRHRKPQPLVALYYPIRQLQREYIPTATPLDIKSQSQLAQRLVASFDAVGTALVRSQVPFIVIDEEAFGAVSASSTNWTPLVIVPDGGEPDQPLAERAKCIAVTENAQRDVAKILQEHFPQRHRIEPASPMIVLGNFAGTNATTTLIVNTDTAPYRGTLHLPKTPRACRILNPQTGEIRDVDSASTIAIELGANESVMVVSE